MSEKGEARAHPLPKSKIGHLSLRPCPSVATALYVTTVKFCQGSLPFSVFSRGRGVIVNFVYFFTELPTENI